MTESLLNGDLVVDSEVKRCAVLVRRVLGSGRQQERRQEVEEAERGVRHGQRHQSEPDGALEAVHRVLETSTSQHDQVERVADDTEETDGWTEDIVDDRRQTVRWRRTGRISVTSHRQLSLLYQWRHVGGVYVTGHVIARHVGSRIDVERDDGRYVYYLGKSVHNGVCRRSPSTEVSWLATGTAAAAAAAMSDTGSTSSVCRDRVTRGLAADL